MVHIPVIRISSEFKQRALRAVQCEKCGCDYVYLMIRRGAASEDTIAGIGEGRIIKKAQTALASRLEKDIDPVECPDCGWFQEHMLPEIQRRFWAWTPWGQGTGINPNAEYPDKRGHLPGMPLPIRVTPGTRPKDQTGFRVPPDLEFGKIVTIQPLEDPFPNVCVICLQPANSSYAVNTSSKEVPGIRVPACSACVAERNRRVTILTLACLIGLPAIVGLVGGIVLALKPDLLPNADANIFARFMQGGVMAGILGFFPALGIWKFLRDRLPEHAWIVGFDLVRGTFRLTFKDPQFTQLLRECIAGQPLLPPE